jgi:dipeptide transport system permease protein
MALNSTPRTADSLLDVERTFKDRLAYAGRFLWRDRSGIIGLIIFSSVVFAAIFAPWIAPHDPMQQDLRNSKLPPAWTAEGVWEHPFGTDSLGRDIFSRILYGARIAFSVGGISIGIATVFGVATGLVAGYAGGAFDTIIMRLFDVILAFPAILLAIVVLAMMGPGSSNAILAIAIVNIPAFARLTRANVLVERNKEYVEATRSVGAKPSRIIFRTIFPNTVSTILVQITIALASAVLLESALSFLGLGTPLPAPSWGSMLSVGRGYLPLAPWYGIFPGLAITMMVMGFYLLGDGLRDAFDPKMKE